MTVKLDLTPDTEAGLIALARAQGLSLEAYAEKVLRERSAATRPISASDAAQRAQAFRAFTREQRRTPPLSDDAISRENLVRDGQ